MMRAAVVGAGYAGMAAAVSLAQRGVSVTVFESAAVPGGRARRVEVDGTVLDNGQHLVVGAYTELLGLMRELGVPRAALLRRPLELRYLRGFSLRARRLPAPLGLLAGLLGARGVTLGERLGAIRFMGSMRRAGFRVAPDCSVQALLERHGQHGRIGHYLWRPLCVSALNTPARSASANVFLAVLRDSLLGAPGASDLLVPATDLSRLFPEPAAAFVRAHGGTVHLGSPVRRITQDGGLQVDGTAFDGVVLACAPQHAARLLADLPALAPLRAALGEYAYEPIYTCYLQYPAAVALSFPMLGMDAGLVQWVFDRGQLNGPQGLLACVISAQGDHQQLTHEALAERCHAELAAQLPQLPAPRWSQVIAEKRATIACPPGLARVAQATGVPGLVLAGDYTDPEYPPTLEAAVRSGLRAANLLRPAPAGAL